MFLIHDFFHKKMRVSAVTERKTNVTDQKPSIHFFSVGNFDPHWILLPLTYGRRAGAIAPLPLLIRPPLSRGYFSDTKKLEVFIL